MIRKIYFMGIKGVGMASLAVIAKEAGFIVEGSDTEEEFITDKILKEKNIDVRAGFREENPKDFFGNLSKNECLFIATAAHGGFDNIEAQWAKDNSIKVVSHGEVVGMFMEGSIFERTFEGISVSGAHGKTTIAGMLSASMTKLNMSPSYTVGTSEIFPIGAAGHLGDGKYFVAEADEYVSEGKYDRRAKFLYQKPKYLIINNIDFDHPDVYPDLNSIISAYKELTDNLQNEGLLIVNGDDENIKNVIPNRFGIKVITYGANQNNEFVIKNFKEEELGSSFDVLRNGTLLGRFKLSVPGYHNAKNSLSVIALLIELGISIQKILEALYEFKGVKRRLERLGETKNGVLVFDDYAHHPEEIKKSLEALTLAFPAKKITLVFQAHTYERTRSLMSEFIAAFSGVFELIILPTFASARDLNLHDMTEDEQFVEKVRIAQSNVKLIKTISGVVEYIRKNLRGSDKMVITMGAGDVYKVGEQLTANN